MYDLKQASVMLGVSEHTVKEWDKQGRIKITTIDNKSFIKKDELDKFIKDYKVKLVSPEQHNEMLGKVVSDMNKDNNIYVQNISSNNFEKVIGEFRKENNLLSPEEIEKLIQENK